MNEPQKHIDNHRTGFLQSMSKRRLLTLNIVFASIYFLVITFTFAPSNRLLFALLILGEIFHLTQVVGYCWTVWGGKRNLRFMKDFDAHVDVYITVAGEPVEIVRETVRAAKAMDYANKSIYILNDGYVAKKSNWKDMELLAKREGIGCITRRIPGGAKAGNINNAMRETKSAYIAIFDADHVPHPDFLRKTMGFFSNRRMGFVQTPQYYHNHHVNAVTAAAWEQQTLFFGPILKGKDHLNSVFMCGTNMVISRQALIEAGGMCETNIAEDFLTSLFIHARGWKSTYVPEVLAEGLAPEDFLSYYKQQYRWTRGSLEVIFKHNPLFMSGMSWAQKFQYLISASYYLSGLTILLDALLPIIFLFTGQVPVHVSTMNLAFVFIPYILLNLYVLQASSGFSYSFRAISFSLSSWYLQIRAVVAVLLNHKTAFAVTSKSQIEGNFLYLVTPHIIYIIVAVVGFGLAFSREGLTASLAANMAWVILTVCTFIPFMAAAAPNGVFSGVTALFRKMRRLSVDEAK